MKKIIIALALVMTLTLPLAGCSGINSNGAKSFVTSKGNCSLEILFYADSGKCELTLNVYG